MEYIKLQSGCLLVVLYVLFVYCNELRRMNQKHKLSFFDGLLALSIVCIILDGVTVYTVNHLDTVNDTVNMVLHMLFLISLDSVIFLLFLYMLTHTGGMPEKKSRRVLVYAPYVVNILVVIWNINSLEYRNGILTNYSMGVSAYACFVIAGIYLAATMLIFLKRWNYIEKRKRISIFTYQCALTVVTGYQMIVPEALVSSIAVAILILGVYMNMENPTLEELKQYHNEMVLGFATLMEGKDGNTGGHVRRSAQYAVMLAQELKKRGYYTDVLTKDYIKNLYMAAPLHDIGKISVPDAILQKPGKLTDEEFSVMKQHTVTGGKIIKDTFGNLGDEEYNTMAYQVALCHHEKWNGNGYPNGLKENEIPLCARIMAVADVFDAVSEKRCYRDAMPLDKCFDIIRSGSGSDFDPIVADTFLDIRPEVVKVYNRI